MGYDTLHTRPSISKAKQVGLLGRSLLTHLVARPVHPESEAGGFAYDGAQLAASQSGISVSASYDTCHHIARAAHSNFYYAFFFLPKPRRDALAALYAFMRLVDDVADEGHDLGDQATWSCQMARGFR